MLKLFPSERGVAHILLLLLLLGGAIIGVYLATHPQIFKPRASGTTVLVDDRFGLSGECQIAASLGVKWFYNWGHGAYANQDEELCKKAYPDMNIFYSVGMIGNGSYFASGETDFDQNYKNKYLLDAQDRDLYNQLKGLFEGIAKDRGNWPYSADKVLQSFLLIPDYARNNPGAVYGIGNEPDWGPYYTPEEYAKTFYIYSTRIKKYDPQSKVMVKGLTSVSPYHAENMCRGTGSSSIKQNYCNPDGSISPYKWARNFREEYKKLYGEYPKVDIWGIHPYTAAEYIVNFSTDSSGISRPNSYSESNWDNAWIDARNQIVNFRDVFLKSIGEEEKEIWVPEFGVGGKATRFGGLSNEDKLIAKKYMSPLLDWLKTTNYVQKWFWYNGSNRVNTAFDSSGQPKNGITSADWVWPELSDISCIRENDCSDFNEKGKTYREYAQKSPPVPNLTQSPTSPYNCSVTGAWIIDPNQGGAEVTTLTTLSPGSDYNMYIRFNVGGSNDSGDLVYTHYAALFDNADRINIPAQCYWSNNQYQCAWENVLKSGATGDHNIRFFVRDVGSETTQCNKSGNPVLIRYKSLDSDASSKNSVIGVSPSTASLGSDVVVRWNNTLKGPSAKDWVGIYAPLGERVDWFWVNTCSYDESSEVKGTGSCPWVVKDGLADGTYQVKLLNGDTVLGSTSLTVGLAPVISVSEPVGYPGNAKVSWNFPGNKNISPSTKIWIGLFQTSSKSSEGIRRNWVWVNSCSQDEGPAAKTSGVCTIATPVGFPGAYEFRLFQSDELLGKVPFKLLDAPQKL